ncbi:MAG TPA: ATP-binding protein, partial [Candidatus Methylomirabilis sp.]
YTTKEGGTGLGLSIAQKIVDSLGGRIEVESRVGEGTTFRVLFKKEPADGS